MPPGESHVSRISKEYYVNYFNSSHRELGRPVRLPVIIFHCPGLQGRKYIFVSGYRAMFGIVVKL